MDPKSFNSKRGEQNMMKQLQQSYMILNTSGRLPIADLRTKLAIEFMAGDRTQEYSLPFKKKTQVQKYLGFLQKLNCFGEKIFWLCTWTFERREIERKRSQEELDYFYLELNAHLLEFATPVLDCAWVRMKTRDNTAWMTSNAKVLLELLLAFKGAGIPPTLLKRLRDKHESWGQHGEVVYTTPSEAGVRKEVVLLASSDQSIAEAVRELQDLSLVRHNGLAFDPVVLTEGLLATEEFSNWKEQAICLLCFAFPLHASLFDLFGVLGRTLIKQAICALDLYETLKKDTQASLAEWFVPVLIASSNFLKLPWKLRALDSAEMALSNAAGKISKSQADFLYGWLQVRRLNLSKSDERCPLQSSPPLDARGRAIASELVLLGAQRLYLSSHLESALVLLKPYTLLNQTLMPIESKMEEYSTGLHHMLRAKIYRVQGNFAKSREILVTLLRLYGRRSPFDLTLDFAQVQCELGNHTEAEGLLREFLIVAKGSGWGHLGRVTRLHLLIAEVLLEQGRMDEAREIYIGLKDTSVPSLRRNIELINRLRISLGLARICHSKHETEGAMKLWRESLERARSCGWEEGFVQVVIFFSMADLLRKVEEEADRKEYINQASRLFHVTGRQYWYLGLGSTWLNRILWSLNLRVESD